MLKNLIILLISLLVLQVYADDASITILHTNDHHGHLLPFNIPGQKSVGGMPARMTLIKEVRSEVKKKMEHFYYLIVEM